MLPPDWEPCGKIAYRTFAVIELRDPGYPVPAVDLPSGDSFQEVHSHCNPCRRPHYINMQPPLPDAALEADENQMNKTLGARIPEEREENRSVPAKLPCVREPQTVDLKVLAAPAYAASPKSKNTVIAVKVGLKIEFSNRTAGFWMFPTSVWMASER